MSHYASKPGPPALRLRPMLPLLLLASMVGPLTINIILPSLPGLAATFSATRESVQLTISLYMATMAVGQLFVGTISDRFGRKPTLIVSALIYVLGSLLAMLATSIETLVAARMLQALGGTAGMSLARAVISDVSSRTETARILAYLTATMVIAPMAAPNIGAYLHSTFGWWSIFAFCGALGLTVALLASVQMQETRPASLNAATFSEVIARTVSLSGNLVFLRQAMVTALATASYFCFLGGAPHLIIDAMGRSPAEFGKWLILLGVGYASGNLASARLSGRIGMSRLTRLGTALMICGASIMVVLALAGQNYPLAVFVPAMFITFSNGLVMPNATAGAIQTDPKAAGAASGLVGFLQLSCAALSSFLIGWIAGDTALPIALGILTCGLLSLGLMWSRVSPK